MSYQSVSADRNNTASQVCTLLRFHAAGWFCTLPDCPGNISFNSHMFFRAVVGVDGAERLL